MEKTPNTAIVWHRLEAVPTPDYFECPPACMWRGEIPECVADAYLVALKDGRIVWSEGFNDEDQSFEGVDSREVAFWAFPYWK